MRWRANSASWSAPRGSGWRSNGSRRYAQNEEAAMYRTAGIAYAPRQGPFANVAELGLVLGLPPILVERALPHVTVFSGHAEINVLDARPEVLAALPGMTPDLLYGVLAQRGAGAANPDFVLGLLGPAKSGATVEGSKATRVTARI